MPEIPENREIERLLRAYGRKRQEEVGAAPELHPATRRMLLDEVGRVYKSPAGQGKTEKQSWLQWAGLFWPRLAMTAGLFLALGALIWWSVREEPGPTQLAKSERAWSELSQPTNERYLTRNAPSAPPVAEPSPLPEPELVRQDPDSDKAPVPAPTPRPASLPAQPPAAVVTRSEPSAPPPTAPDEMSARALSRPAVSRAVQAQPEPSATPPASPVSRMSAADSVVNRLEQGALVAGRLVEGAGDATPFSNVLAAALAEAAPRRSVARTDQARAVLSSFSFSQVGNEITLLDSDGSVYTGRVMTASAPTGQANYAAQPQDDYSISPVTFSASGVNRTLNELVTVQATVQFSLQTNQAGVDLKVQPLTLSPTSPPATSPEKLRLARPGAAVQAGAAGRSVPLQIEGKAKVGTKQQIEIRAVPEAPRR